MSRGNKTSHLSSTSDCVQFDEAKISFMFLASASDNRLHYHFRLLQKGNKDQNTFTFIGSLGGRTTMDLSECPRSKVKCSKEPVTVS